MRSPHVLLLVLLGLLVACTPSRRGGSSGSSGDDDDSAAADDDDDDDVVGQEIAVVMETDYGVVGFDLYPDAAPVTVDNFLDYVDIGFYDGGDGLGPTLFHRVLDGFVAQGGGYTVDGVLKETLGPIVNEASSSGLSNTAGTIAMARTDDPNSATSQFYVNLVDNLFLDPGQGTEAGYAVFGQVSYGWDVMQQIGAAPANSNGLPNSPIRILWMARE